MDHYVIVEHDSLTVLAIEDPGVENQEGHKWTEQ